MSKKTSIKRVKEDHLPPVSFAINRIELIDSSYNTPENIELKKGDKFTIRLKIDLSANIEKSTLLVRISSFIVHRDITIVTVIVDNEYSIKNLSTYLVNQKFKYKNFIEFIADLSLSHTRGIHATYMSTTMIKNIFLPVVKLSDIVNEPIEQS